jgi:hypothetical protein
MYNWSQVAERTHVAYSNALAKPCSGELGQRISRLLGCGPVFGLIAVIMAALDMLWYRVVCWLDPEQSIELARDLGLHT